MKKEEKKQFKPGPMKGDALREEILETAKYLDKKHERDPVFKKVRPKSAYHDKFARLSTGVHSIYSKRK